MYSLTQTQLLNQPRHSSRTDLTSGLPTLGNPIPKSWAFHLRYRDHPSSETTECQKRPFFQDMITNVHNHGPSVM
ncbi:hypothetical protein TNCT_371491 [Trichonephila clavata]|uniref:Uncharacterized protein n=1 Tax=Trichonephila clavata TaxID=2740835 RepID=A0A8X6FAQ4_TRICU|nr:hypothetical protein TNCT_371491 [Trichonephila clavata]